MPQQDAENRDRRGGVIPTAQIGTANRSFTSVRKPFSSLPKTSSPVSKSLVSSGAPAAYRRSISLRQPDRYRSALAPRQRDHFALPTIHRRSHDRTDAMSRRAQWIVGQVRISHRRL
jgi:hypothetical protein